MTLESLGWNETFASQFAVHREQGLEPARVAREDRDRYLVLDAAGERLAVLAGRFRHDATSRAEWPAVGDWVAVRAEAGTTQVHAVLARTSAFVRDDPGRAVEAQVVAANVDAVFLVCGLDADFNPRRIERYVATAWESGAQPVLLLNKADLDADPAARVAEVEALAPGVPVLALSALEGAGLDALAPWLGAGRTVALVGSSGVGKSTLVNALLGDERQATGAVREDDSRGRHTTTHRELVPLPGGALLLDTPGMRRLDLWLDGEGLDGAFPEIAEFARSCRFRDCSHEREPGCAVRAALQSGALAAERWESWCKLQRELRWLETRQDAAARAAEEKKWKAITRSMKHHPKADRWRR